MTNLAGTATFTLCDSRGVKYARALDVLASGVTQNGEDSRRGREWQSIELPIRTHRTTMSSFPRCANRCTRACVSGFSLLEVLISLVIMSVGLLGVAGLISTTLKGNDSAYMRTQATAQAYNIIDRMRANMDGVNNLDYVLPMPAAPSAATAVPGTCTGVGAGCSSATLAA